MQQNKYLDNQKKRIKVNFLTFAIIYIPTLLFLGCTVIAAIYFGIPPSFFARDPVMTLGAHPFTGMQSHLGVLVWFSSSAICLFCCGVLRLTKTNKVFSSFFLWSSTIAGFLALDDLFLLHEYFFPRYLGLEEKILYCCYAIAFVFYLVKFRKIILNFEPILIVLTLVFFGLSAVIDVFLRDDNSIWRIFFEDGFKLLGIVSWSGYLIRICLQTIVSSLTSQPSIENDIQLGNTSEATESTI
jgi:hypothetical protein